MIASLAPYWQLLRPSQWLKNGFVAAPVFFGVKLFDPWVDLSVALAVLAFCLASSAIYVFNDIRDVEADRMHETKRQRPLASGRVTAGEAYVVLGVLAVLAAVVAVAGRFAPIFYVILALYVVISAAYSLGLKQVALVELFMVASGYVLRLLAGCAAAEVVPTPWIIATTGLLALLLVAGKRRGDMAQESDPNFRRKSLLKYSVGYLDILISVLSGATLVTYLLFAVSDYAQQRFGDWTLITAVFVAFGVLRYVQIVNVEGRGDSPTRLLLDDSWLRYTVLVWALTFFAIIYL